MFKYVQIWVSILLAYLPIIALSAQTITKSNHVPFACDSLDVFVQPYHNEGDTGRNCLWDFSDLTNTTNPLYRDSYLICQDDTSCFATHTEYTTYFYHKDSTMLSLTGFQTSTHKVRFAEPIAVIRYPFAYRDSISCGFSGEGEYNHLRTFRIDGTSSTVCDAVGRLILPDTELDSVMRIHTHRRYFESRWRNNEIIVDDYSWYSPLCRYPLFESLKVLTIRRSDTTVFAKSYYLPQEAELERMERNINERVEPSYNDTVFTEASFLPNPVSSELRIAYTLTRDADLYFSLHSNTGLAMQTTALLHKQAGRHSQSIDMQSYPVGTYVLYVHVNDIILAETIIKI